MAKKKIPHEKTETNPKGAGAQTIVIDWDQVDSMCKIQCTGEEIASVLDINYETLERACKREKECKFVDYIGQKKLGGKASLRRNQWKLAQDGNATMLVWLGKNMLDQTDRTESNINARMGVMDLSGLDDDEVDRRLKQLENQHEQSTSD